MLQVAAVLCASEKLHEHAKDAGGLRTVNENIVAILVRGNSKRGDGNSLHSAAHDGNRAMVSAVANILCLPANPAVVKDGMGSLLQALQSHGFSERQTTPVMVAAAAGEFQVRVTFPFVFGCHILSASI